MADNNELVYIRPRRGTETTMTHTAKSSLVLKEGEMFIEFPDDGIGKGPARIKVGDGVTPYAALDYVLGNEGEYIAIHFLEERSDYPQTLIDQIISGVTLSVFTANTKRIMQLLLNKFNDYLPLAGGTISGNLTVTGDIKGKDVIVKTGTGSVGQTKLVTKTNQAENVTVTLPDQNGTVALLSDMPIISDNYSATSTDGMSGIAVNKALQTLDVTGDSAVAASKTIKSWKETDGKVSITTQDISITKSQVSDFPTIGNGTLTIQKNGTNVQTFTANQTGNATANISVPTALADLTADATHRTVTDTEKTTWNNKSDLALGETSSTAYRGDRGKTAYTHATDSNRLTTATAVGLYKVGSTNQGHISGLTAIAKADITGLGIPGADTYRSIKVNGTELLGTASSTGAINFKNGNNVTISGSGNDITISVPADTNTHRPIKVDGTQILGNNDTPVNFKKGSNITLTGSSTGDITIAATDTTYSAGTNITIDTNNKISTSAEVNQNAFSNIKVGSTTVAAETKTDTVELAGGNNYTTITADASNDKITITGLAIGTTSATAAAGNHTHTTTITTDSGASSLTMNANTKYKITAGGTSYVFTTPVAPSDFVSKANGGTFDKKITIASGGLDVTGAFTLAGNAVFDAANGTTTSTGYTSLTLGNATSTGTAGNSKGRLRLYSNNDKYVQLMAPDDITTSGTSSGYNVLLPNTSGTLSLSSHTHTTTIEADSGTSSLSMAANTKYKLSAGGTSFIFTTPPDTTYSAGTNISIGSDNKISCTLSRLSPTSGGTDLSLVRTGDIYYWNKKQETINCGNHLEWDSSAGALPNTLKVKDETYFVERGSVIVDDYDDYHSDDKFYSALCADIPTHTKTRTNFNGSTYYTRYVTINPYRGKINCKFVGYEDGAEISRDYIGFTQGGRMWNPQSQNLYLQASSEPYIYLRFAVMPNDNAWAFSPAIQNETTTQTPLINLGNSTYKWNNVYANSGTINTSDRNLKKDIVDLDSKAKDFIMDLKPVSYKLKDGTSNRTHYGMIAQDVEDTMSKMNMTALDFAGFCKDQKFKTESAIKELEDPETGIKGKREVKYDTLIEGEYTYGLRYEEFIAPMIYTIQEQQKQIDAQQKQIDELKALVNQLLAK